MSSASTAWVVVSYRLPSEPSRVRVAAWRELRRMGAVATGSGAWIAPDAPPFTDGLGRLRGLIEVGGGEVLVVNATGRDEASAIAMEDLFTAARQQEWVEFISECGKYADEVRHEIAIKKFTSAELDEEEQRMERLRDWHQRLVRRDVFGAASAPEATRRLKDVGQLLDDFAERVFRAVGDQ